MRLKGRVLNSTGAYDMSMKILFVLLVCLAALSTSALQIRASFLINEVDTEKPKLVLQTGHASAVSDVVFAEDGKFLASASKDNTVKIWEVETGRELRSFTGHTAPVKAVCLSKDGHLIASGGNDKTIRIWNVSDGQQRHILTEHSGSIETLVFSADGKMLASGGTDAVIRIWDLTTGKLLYDLEGHQGWITALVFSSDAQQLASGSADFTVKIWDVGKGNKSRTIETHRDKVTALSFNRSGNFLASAASDGKIKVTVLTPKRETFDLSGHGNRVLSLGFLPDDRLISSDSGQIIKKWSVKEKREVSSIVSTASEETEIESAAFNQNAELVAFGKGNRAIEIVRTSNGEKLNSLESQTPGFYSIAFSSNGHWLASGSNDNSIKLFDLRAGHARIPLTGHSGYITCLKFTPDSRYLISAGIDQTIRVWDVVSGKSVRIMNGHRGTVNSIDISSDGKLLVTGSSDRTIRRWNLETGAEEQVWKEHNDEVTSVAFTAGSRSLVSGSSDQSIRLWQLGNSRQAQKLVTNQPDIGAMAVTPDGIWLAFASGKEIKLWNLTLNKLIYTLSGHTDKIYALVFSPDGQQLASAGADSSIKIWQTAAGKEVKTLVGHTSVIHGLAFNQSGEWLASNSEDGSTIIWRKSDGKLVATLISLRAGMEWLVVTPEGLFDGSSSAWSRILWRFGTNTFNTQPVETFFNEFYLPGLLADILSNKSITLPSGQDISKVDRRQPQVEILTVDGQAASQTAIDKRVVRVRVKVTENLSDPLQPDHPPGSGAKDLRLFRNGSLVKSWRGDVLALSEREGCFTESERTARPKSVTCEISVPVTAGRNEFTAYAFNHNNVKSQDGIFSVSGGDNLKRKGDLYVLAIGINRYENKDYNLNFAVADATELGLEIERQQNILGIYTKPKVITLLDEEATKQNILYALGRFSSANPVEHAALSEQSKPPTDLPVELAEKLNQIRAAQPEDVILFYFAGHGFASENSFYLIPHNLGVNSQTTDRLQKLRSNSISDNELERLFEFIDAGKILFVIDACNSGQALESEEKRRGPMNSRGIAQLAFEKGMYILTAAQSFQAALEVSRTSSGKNINHGLLTYSLLEALTTPQADVNTDKSIIEREWFSYAVENVPQIQLQEMKTRHAEINSGLNSSEQKRSDLIFSDLDDTNKRPEDRIRQTPRVFYRRENLVSPFIVAKQ